jgi:Tol biopolymer transport system component
MNDSFAHLRVALGDRYQPVRELGGGGMAQVYLAEDVKHQRQVAIKVLRPEFSISLGAERFLREIAVIARLQHPHILPLLDSGRAPFQAGWTGWQDPGDRPHDSMAPTSELLYFVMPYVEGESLRARLAREGRLPLTDVIRILSDVADALAYAHEKGVVHRDIKPDNIMLAGRHAVVMDFGVAKAVSASVIAPPDLTGGVALGTPAYMAPEQATADPTLDHRVDIYALGILGYEMLTGRPPFTGATVHELLTAQVLDDPEPIETLRPDVPPALAAVLLRCLAKRPADRWSSAAEVVAQLEPFSTSSGGMTPTSVTPVRAGSPLLPRWLLVTVALLGLVAIGFLANGARTMMMHPLELRQATILGTVREAALSPDGQFIALIAPGRGDSTRLGVQEAAGGTPRWLLTGLHLRNPSWSRDGTELRFVAYEAPGISVVRGIPRLGGQPRYIAPMVGDYPAFSADDQSLASFRASTADLSIRNLATGDTTSIRAPADFRWSVGAAWAPSSKWIALTLLGFDERRTAIACLSTDGRSTHLLVQDSVELSAPVWPTGGGALYYLRQEGSLQALRRLNVSGDCERKGTPEEVAAGLDIGDRTPGLPTAASLSLTSDGRRLSYLRSVKSSNLRIRSTTGTSPSALTNGTAYNYSARFAPGDSLLAFIRVTDGEGTVQLLPLHSMIEAPLDGSAGAVGLGWSADGEALAVTTETGERPASVTVIQPRNGTRKQLPSARSSAGLTWLKDGRVVYQVAGNRGFSLADTMTGEVAPMAAIDTTAGFVFAPRVSPDGKQLAFFWARAINRGVWLAPFDGTPARPVAADALLQPVRWSADGRHLYVARGGRDGNASLVAVLTLETGQLQPLLMLERGDLVEDISGDGRTVLFSHVETQSDIWLLNNPKPGGS